MAHRSVGFDLPGAVRIFALTAYTLAAGCSGSSESDREVASPDASAAPDSEVEPDGALTEPDGSAPDSGASLDADTLEDATALDATVDSEVAPQEDAAADASVDGSQLSPAEDFATGANGWRAVDLPTRGAANASYATILTVLNDLSYSATGGQSGGYLSRIDTTVNSFFFDAPESFRGDLSAFAGGTIEFYLKSTHATWLEDAVLVLVTANDVVLVQTVSPPATSWTSYSLPLTHSAFRYKNNLGAVVSESDFAAALADVRALRIPGEWGGQVEETVGFDSVALKTKAP